MSSHPLRWATTCGDRQRVASELGTGNPLQPQNHPNTVVVAPIFKEFHSLRNLG